MDNNQQSVPVCSCGGGDNDGHAWNCPWQEEQENPNQQSVEGKINERFPVQTAWNVLDTSSIQRHAAKIGYLLAEEQIADLQSQLAAKEKEIKALKEKVAEGERLISMKYDDEIKLRARSDHYKALAEKQNEYITSLFKRVALHSPYYENGRKLQLEFEALKTQSPDK